MRLVRGGKIKRKPTMALTTCSTSGIRGAGNVPRPGCSSSSLPMPGNRRSFFEGGHQLEKLEFALAVAITRGDENRSELLRAQIAELGGNVEEPGT